MADLTKVAAGQTIRALPAEDWNAFIDAARAQQAGQFNQRFAGELFEQSPTIVQIKNETGVHQPRLSVLGIGEPIPLPDADKLDRFKNEIVFRGQVPTLVHRRFIRCGSPRSGRRPGDTTRVRGENANK